MAGVGAAAEEDEAALLGVRPLSVLEVLRPASGHAAVEVSGVCATSRFESTLPSPNELAAVLVAEAGRRRRPLLFGMSSQGRHCSSERARVCVGVPNYLKGQRIGESANPVAGTEPSGWRWPGGRGHPPIHARD